MTVKERTWPVNARIKAAIVVLRTHQHIRCSFVIPKTAKMVIQTCVCPKEVSTSKRRKGHMKVVQQDRRQEAP